MSKKTKNKYEMGDIVFAQKFNYENGINGESHLFVIIDDEDNGVSIEYFGLIVSSHREKSKLNSNFEYNEPIDASLKNGLKKDSIVKCDQIYSIPHDNVAFKIGSVDVDDFLRFIQAFEKHLKEDKVTN